MRSRRLWGVLSLFLMLSAQPLAAQTPPEFVLFWGTGGSGPGEFNLPLGMDVDPAGNLYVADFNNHRIQVFDNDGNYLWQWGELGTGPGEFYFPEGVAIDPAGFVYIADRNNNRIQKFDLQGNFILAWGGFCDLANGTGCIGEGNGQFYYPWAVAVAPNGDVYVADFLNHRIQKFDSQGNFLLKWGRLGSGIGEFDTPQGVATDADGFVYISDHFNHRVQKFTSQGQYVAQFGTFGDGAGELDKPAALETDAHGRVHVVDLFNHRVQVFEGDGTYLYGLGYRNIAPGGLGSPWDVAIDHNGNVFISEKAHNRISKFGIPEPPEPEGPIIVSVTDVGSDQGGQVRINFRRSRYDMPGAYPRISSYEIFRRIDEGRKAAPTDRVQLDGWEFVGAVPPHHETVYNAVVPTITDRQRGDQEIPWATYFVRAATSDAGLFFDSEADSGYSVDNIPPGKPRDLQAKLHDGFVAIRWVDDTTPGMAADRWAIHRALHLDFQPSQENLFGIVDVPYLEDHSIEAASLSQVVYKVQALDRSGNASPAIAVQLQLRGRVAFSMQSLGSMQAPATLSYSLPQGARVDLRIYDVTGRLVRTLLDDEMRAAGLHTGAWDLRNEAGGAVAPGIYFARFNAMGTDRVVKTVVIR